MSYWCGHYRPARKWSESIPNPGKEQLKYPTVHTSVPVGHPPICVFPCLLNFHHIHEQSRKKTYFFVKQSISPLSIPFLDPFSFMCKCPVVSLSGWGLIQLILTPLVLPLMRNEGDGRIKREKHLIITHLISSTYTCSYTLTKDLLYNWIPNYKGAWVTGEGWVVPTHFLSLEESCVHISVFVWAHTCVCVIIKCV